MFGWIESPRAMDRQPAVASLWIKTDAVACGCGMRVLQEFKAFS